jgi:flagellar biosynthesis anti-sigma factor FlgM
MVDRVGKQQAHEAYGAQSERARATQRATSEQAAGARPEHAQAAEEGAAVLSSGLRDIQRAVETVRRAPEARAERVAELRAQLAAGTYQVTSTEIAAKLIENDDLGI